MRDEPLPPNLAVDQPPIPTSEWWAYIEASADAEPHYDPEALEHPEQYEAGYVARARVHAWRPDTDDQAEWVGRHMVGAVGRMRPLREQAAEWKARIDGWLSEVTARDQATVAWAERVLTDYGARRREATGTATLTLPSVVVRATAKQPKAAVVDDDGAAVYLAEVRDLLATDYVADDALTVEQVRGLERWAEAIADTSVSWEDVAAWHAKVYLGPLRKLVSLGEQVAGVDRVVSLACGHTVTTHHPTMTEADAADGPEQGEVVDCPVCEPDPIEGPVRVAVAEVAMVPQMVPCVVGPDGLPVPGTEVEPGGLDVKVTARA